MSLFASALWKSHIASVADGPERDKCLYYAANRASSLKVGEVVAQEVCLEQAGGVDALCLENNAADCRVQLCCGFWVE